MLTVTITKHGTNGMKVSGHGASRQIQTKYGESHDPGALAAIAVQMANTHGGSNYIILGPSCVIELIPEGIRCKLK